MTEQPKYTCFKTTNVDGRCLKTTIPISEPGRTSYPTLAECMKNCNLEDEEIALEKLRKKYKLKNLIQFIRPNLTDTFSKLNDVPILNYENKIYNKKIFNESEMKTLYALIVLRDGEKSVFTNLFFNDFLKSSNGIEGAHIDIDIIPPFIQPLKIIYTKNDFAKEYIYHFMDEEYRKNFDTEVESFISSSKLFLVKAICIMNNITNTSHQTFMIIKKGLEKIDLQVFIFDPVSENYKDSKIGESLELFIQVQFSSKYKYTFFNLSKLYGVQDFEKYNPLQISFSKIIEVHSNSILQSLNAFLMTASSIFSECHNDLDIFKKKTYEMLFIGLSEKNIFKEDIDKIIEEIFKNITTNPQNYADNYNKMNQIIFDVFKNNIVKPKCEHLLMSEHKIAIEKDNILTKLNEYKYYDYFNGLCQLWCYYTIVLMLINPTIDPYSIIKASFYQSSNIKKMNALYEIKKEDIESSKNDESEAFIFDTDFIEKEMEKLENLKIKIRKNKFDPILDEYTRILYVKITNFIIINILYNRTFDKYLLYSIGQHDRGADSFKKEMIPQKVNAMLNDFTFSSTENLIEIVKKGKNIIDVNALILQEKQKRPFEMTDDKPFFLPKPLIVKNEILLGGMLYNDKYYEKYLKYKKKYMKLKNHL
jgi:hypothetical protein